MKRYLPILFIVFIVAIVLLVVAAACSGSPSAEDSTSSGDSVDQAVSRGECDVYGAFASVDVRMVNERSSHSAVLLDDNRVLVVGGRGRGSQQGPLMFPYTEIYDPATGQWTKSGDMATEREFFTLLSLGDGSILVAGGTNRQYETTRSAEVRDPDTGEWSTVGKMTTGRERGAAVLLDDGRVLYTGGRNRLLREQESTEIFDPATGEWTEAAPMSQTRSIHTATLLNDGRVLVAGGGKPEGPFFATAEVYDPATDTWTPTGSMRLTRILHTATLLPDGRVLVVGGKGDPVPDVDSQLRRTAEIWDPATGEWSPAGSMASGRAEHTATLLPDGRVMVIGSLDKKATSEIYDPATDTWYESETMGETRYRHTATLLADGEVFVNGGQSSDRVSITSEVFSGKGFAASGACATGVAGNRSALVGVDPVAQVEEAEPTPGPSRGSSNTGRDASKFVFSVDVMDADDNTDVTVAPLGTLVRLDVGERMASPIRGDGLTVTFLEVLEDSRCPEDVTCVTAGEAKIKIHIWWFGQNVGELTLTLEGGQAEPSIGSPGGAYFVALASLEPYPTSETAGSLDQDYVATIAVFLK